MWAPGKTLEECDSWEGLEEMVKGIKLVSLLKIGCANGRDGNVLVLAELWSCPGR